MMQRSFKEEIKDENIKKEMTKEFIDFLSNFTGYELQEDKSKNWWGIHTFDNGDKLDIHVDAGRHPKNNLKKSLQSVFIANINLLIF